MAYRLPSTAPPPLPPRACEPIPARHGAIIPLAPLSRSSSPDSVTYECPLIIIGRWVKRFIIEPPKRLWKRVQLERRKEKGYQEQHAPVDFTMMPDATKKLKTDSLRSPGVSPGTHSMHGEHDSLGIEIEESLASCKKLIASYQRLTHKDYDYLDIDVGRIEKSLASHQKLTRGEQEPLGAERVDTLRYPYRILYAPYRRHMRGEYDTLRMDCIASLLATHRRQMRGEDDLFGIGSIDTLNGACRRRANFNVKRRWSM